MNDKDRIILFQKQLSIAVKTLGRIANGMERFNESAAEAALEEIERLDEKVAR